MRARATLSYVVPCILGLEGCEELVAADDDNPTETSDWVLALWTCRMRESLGAAFRDNAASVEVRGN